MTSEIQLGLELLCSSHASAFTGKKLGLLCNQASTDSTFSHSRDRIQETFPGQLTCLFSPQHGFFCEKQDNMIESGHGVDQVSGLPVYSLYGETRKPHSWMFEDIDVLLVDLVDVGTRVYTFVWTVVHCLQTAAETGVTVVVLDRPNPIGGHLVEGNILSEEYTSFVGLCGIPMRHGMTVGELALYCNREMEINAPLEVIRAGGWKRTMTYPDTRLPWVFPSPNMPTFSTALVYPGQVIWEGTNVSEARGTTLPFELFGAPFLEHSAMLDMLETYDLPGCRLRPLVFEPTSGKWAETACQGFQIHVTQPDHFRPYRTSLALLQTILHLYPDDFAYKDPPYEYEYQRLPMDLILGDRAIRLALESGTAVNEIERSWQDELQAFLRKRGAVLLYE